MFADIELLDVFTYSDFFTNFFANIITLFIALAVVNYIIKIVLLFLDAGIESYNTARGRGEGHTSGRGWGRR